MKSKDIGVIISFEKATVDKSVLAEYVLLLMQWQHKVQITKNN